MESSLRIILLAPSQGTAEDMIDSLSFWHWRLFSNKNNNAGHNGSLLPVGEVQPGTNSDLTSGDYTLNLQIINYLGLGPYFKQFGKNKPKHHWVHQVLGVIKYCGGGGAGVKKGARGG